MSELHYFLNDGGRTAVSLSFSRQKRIDEWQQLRRVMFKSVPEGFTRDEWAYLAGFLAKENLEQVYQSAFGGECGPGVVSMLARPRSPIAVWLPNNVSMLGPLTFILLSLTGARLELKAGSSGDDLTGVFLTYAREHLEDCQLRDDLHAKVRLWRFDRADARNAELARQASVRIVFGSDAACQAVHALEHPPSSLGVSFLDHRSEAWLEAGALREETLIELVKVFAVFGQAGCTSPARVVLIDGDREQALGLQQRLLELWPRTIRADAPQHQASRNVRDVQQLRALGWEAYTTPRNAAVVAVGEPTLEAGETSMSLKLTWGSVEQACASLPPNIQTIGHAVSDASSPLWLERLAATRALRFVPLRQMHHFGPIWDGQLFWRQLFEWAPISL